MKPALQPVPDIDALIAGVMAFEAPYLIEKLLKEHICTSADEAAALFTEVKRYLLLWHIDPSKSWQMHSLRIDEAWHQLVLFTHEYTAFCVDHFGRYLHHMPSNAPQMAGEPVPEATFAELAARYEEVFGEPLPSIWRDETTLTVDRRVVNYHVGELTVHVDGGRAELRLGDQVMVRLDAWAADILDAISATGTFFIRELPGDLSPAEQVAICEPLVRLGVLRVAP
jgi:hypothetical protein